MLKLLLLLILYTVYTLADLDQATADPSRPSILNSSLKETQLCNVYREGKHCYLLSNESVLVCDPKNSKNSSYQINLPPQSVSTMNEIHKSTSISPGTATATVTEINCTSILKPTSTSDTDNTLWINQKMRLPWKFLILLVRGVLRSCGPHSQGVYKGCVDAACDLVFAGELWGF